MRQWGSSIHHNGLSFYLATVPEGSLLYHGTHDSQRIEGFEWLALEVEHAANFARSWEPPPDRDKSFSHGDETLFTPEEADSLKMEQVLAWHRFSHQLGRASLRPSAAIPPFEAPPQKALAPDHIGDNDGDKKRKLPPFPKVPLRGYLQTYRAARPLNLVYIDGQAAAKCEIGSIDSQNHILLDYPVDRDPDGFDNDFLRARDLCRLAASWGSPSFPGVSPSRRAIDGFIRMEAGFEVIYCDFAPGGGLDLVSVNASPFSNETAGAEAPSRAFFLEWMRAVAGRYDGLPRGRVEVDFSSAVSAFAYPVNISNPDPERQTLPRIVSASREERLGIRARLGEVVAERSGRRHLASVDWQAVADGIASRYAERLWYLSEGDLGPGEMLSVIDTLLDPFSDYPSGAGRAGPAARSQCAEYFLGTAVLGHEKWTPEDRAIYAAIETVSGAICNALFDIRNMLVLGEQERRRQQQQGTVEAGRASDVVAADARQAVRELMTRLDWATWKRCGRCADPGQVCFTVMFPVGAQEDHDAPRCKNLTEILSSYGYWQMGVPFAL
ncbi:hypothetical protein NKR23_g4253 [Pleurostoma richardsiae]|uniref:Uncharacterized protein n=1 Tax=Pleurostoma richardsiae TaxID=41990 RepID=A0AA38VG01_9PEZI|nr:hypothetical protein NKR23_g4253 [Pleurostoma richardsiae]